MEVRKVKELQGEEYLFINDSQEVQYILESIGLGRDDLSYYGLIVKLGEGEYKEIWGTDYVPYLESYAERLL